LARRTTHLILDEKQLQKEQWQARTLAIPLRKQGAAKVKAIEEEGAQSKAVKGKEPVRHTRGHQSGSA